jgi:hypothetical protein
MFCNVHLIFSDGTQKMQNLEFSTQHCLTLLTRSSYFYAKIVTTGVSTEYELKKCVHFLPHLDALRGQFSTKRAPHTHSHYLIAIILLVSAAARDLCA